MCLHEGTSTGTVVLNGDVLGIEVGSGGRKFFTELVDLHITQYSAPLNFRVPKPADFKDNVII